MKKVFVLSMLVSLAMVCSCQKKDSTAQQQPAEPTTEPGAGEEALAERLNSLEEKVNSLDQRVKELAEKEDTAANARTDSADVQGQVSDPAQVQAEKDRMIQQLSAMTPPDTSQLEKAEKGKEIHRRQQQPGEDELEMIMQRKQEAAGISPTPQ